MIGIFEIAQHSQHPAGPSPMVGVGHVARLRWTQQVRQPRQSRTPPARNRDSERPPFLGTCVCGRCFDGAHPSPPGHAWPRRNCNECRSGENDRSGIVLIHTISVCAPYSYRGLGSSSREAYSPGHPVRFGKESRIVDEQSGCGPSIGIDRGVAQTNCLSSLTPSQCVVDGPPRQPRTPPARNLRSKFAPLLGGCIHRRWCEGGHESPPCTWFALPASHRAIAARWLSFMSLTGGLPLLAR